MQRLLFAFLSVSFWVLPVDAQQVSIVIGEAVENDRSSVAESRDGESEKTEPDGPLRYPFGLDFDAAGNMVIVELEGGRAHSYDTSGRLTRLAGNGTQGYAGDGGPAIHAVFNGMHNVAVTPSGDVYISDSWNHCVRKIDAATGIISTIAGSGQAGFSGDGGPATKATFDFVMCVSLNAANDKIYLADLRNRRIRMVDLKTNIVSTIAGNGEKGVPADGSVAADSPLVDPRAVAVDSRDNVYILERGGHALRVVRPGGTIHTVAGTGERGTATGPALSAQLGSPKHLTVDAHDNVFIADDQNARVLKYDPRTAVVTSVLGRDAAPPLDRWQLKNPHGVCVHSDGSLYVLDTYHHRVLRVQLPD